MLGCFSPCPLGGHLDIAQWSLFLEAESLPRYLLVLNYSLGIEEGRLALDAYRIARFDLFARASDDEVSGFNLHRLTFIFILLAKSYASQCQLRDTREVSSLW